MSEKHGDKKEAIPALAKALIHKFLMDYKESSKMKSFKLRTVTQMVIKRRKPRQDCSIFQQMKKWTAHLIVTVTVKAIRIVTSSPTSMQCGLSLFPTSLCTRMILRSQLLIKHVTTFVY